MFSGCFVYGVDEKNRVSMPSKFRKQFDGRFVITKGPDGCLWALSKNQWRIVLGKAKESVALQRFLVASAEEHEPTEKGPCLIADDLRRHADIKPGAQVAIVGMGNRVEIWSAQRWERICAELSLQRVRQELPELF